MASFEYLNVIIKNQMSRQSTQPDSDPLTLRLGMISTNLARIYSQNHKLQELLQHKEQLSKLKDIAEVSANHWQRLATLAETVQQMYHRITHDRQLLRQALDRQTEDIQNTVIEAINNLKNNLSRLDNRLRNIEMREKNKICSTFKKEKTKAIDRLDKMKKDSFDLLTRAQQQYCIQTNKQMDIYYHDCETELNARNTSCRINLGCLENLIAYFYWKEHAEDIAKVTLSDIANSNFQSLTQELQILEASQRKIKGEVDWFKKTRKSKQTAKINDYKYQPRELATVTSLGFGISDCQQSLVGLDKICGQKSRQQNKSFSKSQIEKLITIRQRLKILKQRHQQYSSFYNDSF